MADDVPLLYEGFPIKSYTPPLPLTLLTHMTREEKRLQNAQVIVEHVYFSSEENQPGLPDWAKNADCATFGSRWHLKARTERHN